MKPCLYIFSLGWSHATALLVWLVWFTLYIEPHLGWSWLGLYEQLEGLYRKTRPDAHP